MKKENALKFLYTGTVILCGAAAAIWSFTANRFQISECLLIVAGGCIAGLGLGLACHAMSVLLIREH